MGNHHSRSYRGHRRDAVVVVVDTEIIASLNYMVRNSGLEVDSEIHTESSDNLFVVNGGFTSLGSHRMERATGDDHSLRSLRRSFLFSSCRKVACEEHTEVAMVSMELPFMTSFGGQRMLLMLSKVVHFDRKRSRGLPSRRCQQS